MPSWVDLKERKIVQWALAYLAGAWLVVEALDLIGEAWGVPPTLVRIAHVALAFGFFATLVLAWYHGEQGRQRASGPELLMLAGILVVAGTALAFVGGDATGEPAGPDAAGTDTPDVTPFTVPERSIAVLPFENHSPNPGDEYLAGAVANEIAGALTKVPGLRVALASSTARFDRSEMAAEEFASMRLGTAYVVDGSVQAHEERIRVTVKLLDATSGELRWNERYDLPRDTVQDILDLQVDVAERVANELATTLTDQSVERMMSGWTDDPVAYDLYLQADSYEGRTLEDHRARIPLLEQAVERDSGFAMAYFMLGDAHYQVAARQQRPAGAEDSSDDAEYKPLLSRAIEIADDPVLRTNLRAFKLLLEGSSEESIMLARSIVLEHPNDPMSLVTLMAAYQSAGRVVDVAEVGSRLLALDPLSPERRYGTGRFTLGLGMDSVASSQFREALKLGDERGWEGLLDVHLFRGDTSAARELVDSARSAGIPSLDVLAFKERAWAGDLEAARTILDRIDDQQLRDRVWRDAPLIAHVSLLTGDTTRADDVLREATAVADMHWESRAWAPGTFAVRGDAPRTADAMRAAMDIGMHQASWIEADPVYARVRDAPEFEEALGQVERLIDRQRREIERKIAEER